MEDLFLWSSLLTNLFLRCLSIDGIFRVRYYRGWFTCSFIDSRMLARQYRPELTKFDSLTLSSSLKLWKFVRIPLSLMSRMWALHPWQCRLIFFPSMKKWRLSVQQMVYGIFLISTSNFAYSTDRRTISWLPHLPTQSNYFSGRQGWGTLLPLYFLCFHTS